MTLLPKAAPRVNYLNNRDILKEIHHSKNTYCWYRDRQADHQYDIILPSIDRINQRTIAEARRNRADRIKRETGEEINDKKIPNTDLVFRITCWDHIPMAPKKITKAEAKKKKIEDKAAEDNKNQAELSAYQKANGLQGQLELEKEFRKASYEAQINEAMYGANEETRIKLEAAKKVYDEILKTEDNLQKNGTYNALLEYRNREQKTTAILADAEQKRAEISRQKEKELSKTQLNQQLMMILRHEQRD